jgi:hypothetical protein
MLLERASSALMPNSAAQAAERIKKQATQVAFKNSKLQEWK